MMSKWEILIFGIQMVIHITQNLMGSKLDQVPSSVFIKIQPVIFVLSY